MKRFLLSTLLFLVLVVLLGVLGLWSLSLGLGGSRQPRGEPAQTAHPAAAVAERGDRQSQILFGDLHVHTTYSGDAFLFSLPLLQGEGAHPPADACDYARHCAQLDFWSINDHAENLTPWQWQQTREAIRECNAVAGDPDDPDLVAFLGWEWTQSAPPPALAPEARRAHYGHKNVILLDTEESRVPTRPIGAGSGDLFNLPIPSLVWTAARAALVLGDLPAPGRALDFNQYAREVRETPVCTKDLRERALPAECREGADTPTELFARLSDWGFPSLVIPHGTSWGIHAPPGASLAPQLARGLHDPARQRLFEVYSGHGSSELYRDQRDRVLDELGREQCAAPQDGYLPCCWQAGELIRARCGDANEAVCEARVRDAQRWFLEAPSPSGFGVVEGSHPDDWLDCGQLADGFLPAFDYRPGMSAQYALAARDPESGDEAGAFRFGLIASSDNHKARAGAGYKEMARKAFSDAYGLRDDWNERLSGEPEAPSPEPRRPSELPLRMFDPGVERAASFYYTAGLVAVHAQGRDRHAIFEALEDRHAYGTSGPRILLWFDVEEPGGGRAPMGSEVFRESQDGTPRFFVRAVGAFAQRPGCPDFAREALGAERLARLCLDECHHPGETRLAIERIEVVRIRPQVSGDEAIASRIEDPWRSFACPPSPDGCAIEFEDPDYRGDEEVLYYVRALQEPSPAVNGDPMGCTRDAGGLCVEARSCPASGPGFDPEDDCLAPVQERAWSSPIWLRAEARARKPRPGTAFARITPTPWGARPGE